MHQNYKQKIKFGIMMVLLVLISSCKTQRESAQTALNDGIISYEVEQSESIIPSDEVKIRINLVFLRNDEGEGGFDSNNPEHLDLINSSVNWMNASLRANDKVENPACYDIKRCYPERDGANYEHIVDTKINFVVGEILMFDDTKYWDNQNCQDGEDDKTNPNCPDDGKRYRCPDDEYSGKWYLNPLSQEINRNPDILPAINIFYTEDADQFDTYIRDKSCEDPSGKYHTQDCSERPSSSLDKEQRIHMRSSFLKYNFLMNCATCESSDNECQNIGTPNQCCPRKQVLDNLKDGMSRTLMHELGHSVEFTSGHCSVCPKEALMHATRPGKKIHSEEIKYAHTKIRNSNLRKYIVDDKPLILNNETQKWDNFLNLHEHFVLHNNSHLTLNNQTHILAGKQLVVDSSTLIIQKGAHLTLEKNSKLVIKKGSKFQMEEGASIILKGNSTLIVECDAQISIDPNITFLNRGNSGEVLIPCGQTKLFTN